jgi:monoamine oxidase
MVAPVVHQVLAKISTGQNDWIPDWPNPADFRFDYNQLLQFARQASSPIGFAPSNDMSVAVIGAGAAGMTAARELYRAGYKVTIYEASDRICGRHWTLPAANATTGMELGAMRFPFFPEPGANNSVFEYYLGTEADPIVFPFPNPGSAPDNTGIYMNQGYGPNDEFYPSQEMIIWANDGTGPNDSYLSVVYQLENQFVTFFQNTVADLYGNDNWPDIWQQIANNYDKMTFSDLVFAPAVNDYHNDGWLGGFGMNDFQSQLFYTIGAGDGSWGAFYPIGAMWFIRCVMFGFNSDLQTLAGLNDASSLPHYNDAMLRDSLGNPLPPPIYSGIQSLVEWLLYNPTPSSKALYDAIQSGEAKLNLRDGITSITNNGNSLTIVDQRNDSQTFDYAVVTPEIWASQLSVELNGFSPSVLPSATISARDESHVIASCKVFFPLKQAYWTIPGCPIPQVIVTDTFIQDAYGVQWSNDDPGVLLASYTWEDDALKLVPYNEAEVAKMVLDEIDRITTTTLGQSVSQYITGLNDAVVFQWTEQLGYNGCAKLYRQRFWTQNYSLLAYNQQHSAQSRLYLAGESYSVEGGWTEPALRAALDAVIRLIQNSGGTFIKQFDVANDYPLFDVNFTPSYTYNR